MCQSAIYSPLPVRKEHLVNPPVDSVGCLWPLVTSKAIISLQLIPSCWSHWPRQIFPSWALWNIVCPFDHLRVLRSSLFWQRFWRKANGASTPDDESSSLTLLKVQRNCHIRQWDALAVCRKVWAWSEIDADCCKKRSKSYQLNWT